MTGRQQMEVRKGANQMADTEREAFEAMIVPAWSRETYVDGDGDVQYVEDWMQGAWMGWSMARAALASLPAEVDDEELPALPTPLQRDDTGHGVDYFTAEQYRQGQRDAVAAYKKKQAALQELADQAQENDMGYGDAVAADRARREKGGA